MYNDPKCKPWTSGSWAPVGYSSRREFMVQMKAVETKKPLDNGAFEKNVTGRVTTTTNGSVSTFDSGNENEKNQENEKSGMCNGVRITVSRVNRSSSILENGKSGTGSDVDAGVDD